MSELISILMPVKNAEPFLPDCLSSIQQQSNGNWELIAVDDHSTDDSHSILQWFSKVDPRISVLKNTGHGIIPALRIAFSKSNGQFISRMDADDLVPPDKLELLLSACRKGGENALATGKVSYFSDDELMDGFVRYENWLNALIDKGDPFNQIFKECPIASPNWMMKRSFLESIGAFEPNTYPEDYDLIFRAFLNGAKTSLVKQVTHLWRDHQSRASRTDDNYADNTFFELKLHYFLKLISAGQTVGLYGAGKKGKRLAQNLIDRGVSFRWFSNNPKKIGKEIYGVFLEDDRLLFEENQPSKIIVAISSPTEQEEVLERFKNCGKQEGSDYFFFC